jgi:hypothetical protein
MCAQCMASAAAAVGGASGVRAWLAAKGFAWVTPVRLHRITMALVAVALFVAALTASGSAPGS